MGLEPNDGWKPYFIYFRQPICISPCTLFNVAREFSSVALYSHFPWVHG